MTEYILLLPVTSELALHFDRLSASSVNPKRELDNSQVKGRSAVMLHTES